MESADHKTSITDLDFELLHNVFNQLDDINSLPSAALTCRRLHLSYKLESQPITYGILQRQLSSLTPFAMSILSASDVPRLSEARVIDLLNILYDEPQVRDLELETLAPRRAQSIGRKHNIISELAVEFAKGASALLFPGDGQIQDKAALSAAEHERLRRAFYRIELYSVLYAGHPNASEPQEYQSSTKQLFFGRHPPWENEQMACAYDFLEKKVLTEIRDLVARDKECNQLAIDYASVGPKNLFVQLWLSQGFGFLYNFLHAKDDDTKKALLKATPMNGTAKLATALATNLFTPQNADELPGDAINALHTSADNDDKGPSTCWLQVHEKSPRSQWVMGDQARSLRERAYVFWDMDRVEEAGILDKLKEVPEHSSVQPMEK